MAVLAVTPASPIAQLRFPRTANGRILLTLKVEWMDSGT